MGPTSSINFEIIIIIIGVVVVIIIIIIIIIASQDYITRGPFSQFR